MIIDTGRTEIFLCSGHFFDCSDAAVQSGNSVRLTPEGKRAQESVREESENDQECRRCGARVHLDSTERAEMDCELDNEEDRNDG